MKKINKNSIEDIVALTPVQEGMLFHYLKDPEIALYFEQLCLEISGVIDIHCFKQSWIFVIETNESLRTTFRWEKVDFPVQIILKKSHLNFLYYDFSDRTPLEKRKFLDEVKDSDKKKNFNLMDVPFRIHLCKTGEAWYEMIVSHHHILYDGWSNGIILREFFNAYEAFSCGKQPGLHQKNPKTRFKKYVTWLKNRGMDREEQYWRNYLYGFDTPTGLSKKNRRQPKIIITGNVGLRLGKKVKDKLEYFTQTHKITMASLFYCTWGLLLQTYNNCEDIVFGTTVSGRSARSNLKDIEHIVGLFINTIPLRVRAHFSEQISDLLYGLNDQLKAREEYEHTSLLRIEKMGLNFNSTPGKRLFDTIVVIENYPIDTQLGQGNNQLSIHSYSMVESTNYDITAAIMLFDEIEINFNYREDLFDREEIERLSYHFLRILQSICEDPGKPISEIEMISEEEKNTLLYDLNNTATPNQLPGTLHELFGVQVERTPDNIAVLGVNQSQDDESRNIASLATDVTYVTYNELKRKSNQLAYVLKEKGIYPDTIVGIMVHPSIEMIVGLLGILKAGGVYLPIDPDSPWERIQYILTDSRVIYLLTTLKQKFKVKAKLEEKDGQARELPLQFIDIGTVSYPGFDPWPLASTSISISTSTCPVSPVNLAYAIYTSGSTGRPKGVMIEHGNISNTINWRKNEYELTVNDRVLQLFSYVFDGFVTSFFTPIVSGSQVLLLLGKQILDAISVKKSIIIHKISHFICSPSFYTALLNILNPGELSYLKTVSLAGEELKSSLVNKSKRINKSLEIVNEYGPTENSVATTFFRDVKPFSRILIGKPIANTKIYILDRTNRLIPLGLVGEICISGQGIARGYLNNPDLTSNKFIKPVKGVVSSCNNKKLFRGVQGGSFLEKSPRRLYKTGDLGRWQPGGNIEFLGRTDQQVKIRGYRIEPGEIENRLTTHENVKQALVVAHADSYGDKYLCAYIVTDVGHEIPGLRQYLSGDLPGYMIPSHFIQLEKIPLTPGGKVDLRMLPEPCINRKDTYIEPRNFIERKLVEIWSVVLNADKNAIGIDDSFFKSGGHSLKVMALVLRIHKAFNVNVPINIIFEYPTIRAIARHIKNATHNRYVSIKKAEDREYFPLSPSQKRLYITWHTELQGIGYNVQNLVKIEGRLSKERLEKTFMNLIERHEILRTSFHVIGEEPVQQVHKEVEFRLEYYNFRIEGTGSGCGGEIELTTSILKNFVRPFDLSKAPLLRVGLNKTGEDNHVLVIDMHHIVADAYSMGIFVNRFKAIYRGEQLLPLNIQYRDFVLWQVELAKNPQERETLRRQEKYWFKEFEDGVPQLNLPLDFPRPGIEHYEGSVVFFELDNEETALLKEIALEGDVTNFMLFLTVFNVLLARICDQEDIPVGTPIAGRKHADLHQVIGLFVNMLVLRSQPYANKTFRNFLRETRQKTLAAYDNQDYPYEDLVDRLSITRASGGNSLFDVVFVWEDLEIELGYLSSTQREEEKMKLNSLMYEKINAPFDLILTGTETNDKVSFSINYRTLLFKKETILQMSSSFKDIISEILKNPDIKLGDIPISYNLLEAKSTGLLENQGEFGF